MKYNIYQLSPWEIYSQRPWYNLYLHVYDIVLMNGTKVTRRHHNGFSGQIFAS